MKINESLHGFTVTEEKYIPEIEATMFMLTHDKSGAPLVFLDRDDRNMTFSIGFRTPPTDDTGVFHIIEHSVLCGSEKFPVKEPFVELLKGSLNTFLNAMTYEDRTVYPVSSRCEKDFLNLTEVYLDAVFRPAMLKNKNIFLQEGWHYEYNRETDELSYNGVVYNEMCGAYSSPDELGSMELRRLLFKDSAYSYDSGGAPDSIPSLTYEDFKKAHETYYHPSNSMIFLDGKINVDKTLSLIASYLDDYDFKPINVEFPIHAPSGIPSATVEFEPNGEPLCRVLFGFGCFPVSEKDKDNALSLLCTTLAGSNDSELKRAMLDTGLCEDLVMSVSRTSVSQLTIEVIGVKPDDVCKIEDKLHKTIRDIATRGIDKKRLFAAMDNNEFKLRESDFGGLPKGVVYALAAYASWNYGIDTATSFEYEESLVTARSWAQTDVYEQLLLSTTVDNPHRATVILMPKKNYESEESARRRKELKAIKEGMSAEKLSSIEDAAQELKEWQNSTDSPENLGTLPTLFLSDVTTPDKGHPTTIEKIGNSTYIHHGISTGKITYLTMAFNADDLNNEELLLLNVLTLTLKNLKTDNYSISDLQSEIKSKLGALSFSAVSYPRADGSGRGTLAFTVTASALERNKDSLKSIIGEILLATDFTDTRPIGQQLVQARSIMEEALSGEALSFALSRVTASLTESGKVNEKMSGYDSYVGIKALCDEFNLAPESIAKKLKTLLGKLAVRERLTVSLANDDGDLAAELVQMLPSGALSSKAERGECGRKSEAIATPGRVSYAVLGAVSPEACKILGALRVVRSILSYEYLWNEIRVKGGAYGAGFIVRKSGEIGFYSYRDPSPKSSLNCYLGAPAFLRALAKDNVDLTKFIVGAVGEYDILTTPRTAAAQALYDYMTGWTPADEARLYDGMLHTDGDALCRAADLIEKLFSGASVCVAACEETLKEALPELKIINR